MTIRIHEADGTPYEHIVEIKEATTRFDIPYNTKYKRLKRSRRQRERAVTEMVSEAHHDDVLLYCLGDVLQSEEEMRDWRMAEWSKDDEERMSGESYEWIRMDADFEWICQMTINMPGYMYVSQLQQDRDVVAQYEVCWLSSRRTLSNSIDYSISSSAKDPSSDINNSRPYSNGRPLFSRHPYCCSGSSKCSWKGRKWMVGALPS